MRYPGYYLLKFQLKDEFTGSTQFSTFREWPQDTKHGVSKDDAGLIPVHITADSAVVPAAQVVNDPVMLFLPGGIRMSCHATQLTDVFRALKHADA